MGPGAATRPTAHSQRRSHRPGAAPRWSRQSVKPPVDAPISAHTQPAGWIWKASSAAASLKPPRLTYGAAWRSSIPASSAIWRPGLSTTTSPRCTSPARISRWACDRFSASPRSTSNSSSRSFRLFTLNAFTLLTTSERGNVGHTCAARHSRAIVPLSPMLCQRHSGPPSGPTVLPGLLIRPALHTLAARLG